MTKSRLILLGALVALVITGLIIALARPETAPTPKSELQPSPANAFGPAEFINTGQVASRPVETTAKGQRLFRELTDIKTNYGNQLEISRGLGQDCDQAADTYNFILSLGDIDGRHQQIKIEARTGITELETSEIEALNGQIAAIITALNDIWGPKLEACQIPLTGISRAELFKNKADKADKALDRLEAAKDRATSWDRDVLTTCEVWQQAVLAFYELRAETKSVVAAVDQPTDQADNLRLRRIKDRLAEFDSWRLWGIDDPPYHLGECQGY